jgi:hypothetical protein
MKKFIVAMLLAALILPVAVSAQDWTAGEKGGNPQKHLGQDGDTAYFKFSGVVTSSTLLIRSGDNGMFCVNPNVATAGATANGVLLTLDELIGQFEDDNHFIPFDDIIFSGVFSLRCATVPPGRYRVNVTAITGGSGVATMRRIGR